MTTKFEFFDYGKNKTTRESLTPTINISKAGRINFNKKFSDLYLKDNLYCLLGYNEKTKQIAIKLSKSNNDNKGIKINLIKSNNSYYISAVSFFKFNKINLLIFNGTFEVVADKDLIIAELEKKPVAEAK
jgi:transposase